jgi:hypothetical protein
VGTVVSGTGTETKGSRKMNELTLWEQEGLDCTVSLWDKGWTLNRIMEEATKLRKAIRSGDLPEHMRPGMTEFHTGMAEGIFRLISAGASMSPDVRR